MKKFSRIWEGVLPHFCNGRTPRILLIILFILNVLALCSSASSPVCFPTSRSIVKPVFGPNLCFEKSIPSVDLICLNSRAKNCVFSVKNLTSGIPLISDLQNFTANLRKIDAKNLLQYIKQVAAPEISKLLDVTSKEIWKLWGSLDVKGKIEKLIQVNDLNKWRLGVEKLDEIIRSHNLTKFLTDQILGEKFPGVEEIADKFGPVISDKLKNFVTSPGLFKDSMKKLGLSNLDLSPFFKDLNKALGVSKKYNITAQDILSCAKQSSGTCLLDIGARMGGDYLMNEVKKLAEKGSAMVEKFIAPQIFKPLQQNLGKVNWKALLSGDLKTLAKSVIDMMPGFLTDTGKFLASHVYRQLSSVAKGALKTTIDGMAKVVGPILNGAAGVASTITSLVNSIDEVRKGNLDAIAGIVQESISLVKSVVTIGLQIFAGFSTALKAATPIGTAISLAIDVLTFIGMGIFKAIRAVEEVEKIIPLTDAEKFETGWRAFWGAGPSARVMQAVQKKQNNNALAKQGLDSLKKDPSLDCLVVPSINVEIVNERFEYPWYCFIPFIGLICPIAEALTNPYYKYDLKVTLQQNSKALLNFNNRAEILRESPDNPEAAISTVFCPLAKPAGEPRTFFGFSYYDPAVRISARCENAIGVEISRPAENRVRQCVLYLGNGTDTATGRPGYSNVFVVEKGVKDYTGAEDFTDIFSLVETGVSGRLDGGGGSQSNILAVESVFDPNFPVSIDFSAGLITQSSGLVLQIQRIQIVYGRKKTSGSFENIIFGCDTLLVDGKGGEGAETRDSILIPVKDCQNPPEVTVVVRQWTNVRNEAKRGSFQYQVFIMGGPSQFKLDIVPAGSSEASHTISMQFGLGRIHELTFSTDTKRLRIKADHGFELYLQSYVDSSSSSKSSSYYYDQPSYLTLLNSQPLDGEGHKGQEVVESSIKVMLDGTVVVIHNLTVEANNCGQTSRSGFPTANNIFLVLGGQWSPCVGGQRANTFILQGAFTGSLVGGKGTNITSNTLIIETSYLPDASNIEVNFREGHLKVNGVSVATVENFNVVIGRENKADRIVITCGVQFVKGQGGTAEENKDHLIIPVDMCDDLVTFDIGPFTRVKSDARKGEFNYLLFATPGDWDVEFDLVALPPDVTLNYVLPFNFSDLQAVTFKPSNGRLYLTHRYKVTHTQSHRLHFSPDENEFLNVAPTIVTQDEVKFYASKGHEVIAKKMVLHQTHFHFKGLDEVNHIFDLANSSDVNIVGGNVVDIFILHGHRTQGQGDLNKSQRGDDLVSKIALQKPVTGKIDGGSGANVLQLDIRFMHQQTVYIDLLHHEMTFEDDQLKPLQILNVQSVQGRLGNEIILVGCDTKQVDGKGGNDTVIVPELTSCSHPAEVKVKIQIFPFPVTRVINAAQEGTFIYVMDNVTSFDVEIARIYSRSQEVTVRSSDPPTFDKEDNSPEEEIRQTEDDTDDQPRAQHIYALNFDLYQMDWVNFGESLQELSYSVQGQEAKHSVFPYREGSLYSSPKFLTRNEVVIFPSAGGTIFLAFEAHLENLTSFDPTQIASRIVEKYRVIAHRLDAYMMIRSPATSSTSPNDAFYLGSRAEEVILTNQPDQPSHLVAGSGNSTVFTISDNTTENIWLYEGYMPRKIRQKVKGQLYVDQDNQEQEKPESLYIIDLSFIVQPMRLQTADGSKFKPDFMEVNDDLQVRFNQFTLTLVNGTKWDSEVKVRLEETLLDLRNSRASRRVRRDADISAATSTPMWSLTPAPINVSGHSLAFLSETDLEDDFNIILDPSITKDDLERMNEVPQNTEFDADIYNKLGHGYGLAKVQNSLVVTNQLGGKFGRNMVTVVMTNFYHEEDTSMDTEGEGGDFKQGKRRSKAKNIKLLLSKDLPPLNLDKVKEMAVPELIEVLIRLESQVLNFVYPETQTEVDRKKPFNATDVDLQFNKYRSNLLSDFYINSLPNLWSL